MDTDHGVGVSGIGIPPGLVLGVEVREPGLDLPGQRRIGRGLTGPLGVAAAVGNDLHVEDGAHGRGGEGGHVRVPPLGGGAAIGGVDHEDLRVARSALSRGMNFGRAELPGECDVLLLAEGLLGKDQQSVLHQGASNLLNRFPAQGGREAQASNFGSDFRTQGMKVEHSVPLAGRRKEIILVHMFGSGNTGSAR